MLSEQGSEWFSFPHETFYLRLQNEFFPKLVEMTLNSVIYLI